MTSSSANDVMHNCLLHNFWHPKPVPNTSASCSNTTASITQKLASCQFVCIISSLFSVNIAWMGVVDGEMKNFWVLGAKPMTFNWDKCLKKRLSLNHYLQSIYHANFIENSDPRKLSSKNLLDLKCLLLLIKSILAVNELNTKFQLSYFLHFYRPFIILQCLLVSTSWRAYQIGYCKVEFG